MEFRVNIADISINLKEDIEKQLNEKVNKAIESISLETITKKIISEINNYDIEYIVESIFDDLNTDSIRKELEKSIKKHIVEKLK